MDCLVVRGLLSGWSGTHSPLYNEAQLDAATEATSTWPLAVFNGVCRGYAVGYGAVYMNDGTTDYLGWMNYAGNTDNPLLQHLRSMLLLAGDFSRGTRYLAIADTDTDNTSPANTNAGAQSFGQMLDYVVAQGASVLRGTMQGLDQGDLRYSQDSSYFNQFRGVILMLQGDGTDISDDLCKKLAYALGAGVPFLVLQRDAVRGQGTFNKIFQHLNLKTSDSTWAHFDTTSIQTNVSTFGTDESLNKVTYLSQHPLFYTGSASYEIIDKDMVSTEFSGMTGGWYYCQCTEAPSVDDPEIRPGLVYNQKGYYEEGQTYERIFDVSANILKPDDWRSTLPAGNLVFDWWGQFQDTADELLVLQSAGLNYTDTRSVQAALIKYRGVTYSGSRSYNVLTVDRVTGAPVNYHTYDVFGDDTNATAEALAAYLNGLDDSVIVCVCCWDEPQKYLATTGLYSALLRFGATPETLTYKMKYRSAYILVGIADTPAGCGIERFKGDAGSSPTSYVTETIDLRPNATPALAPLLVTDDGKLIGATLNGTNDNVVMEANFIQYINSQFNGVAKEFLKRVYTRISLDGKPKNILIASDNVGTGADYSITNTGVHGLSNMVQYLTSLGYGVDVHDIRGYPRAEPSWFSGYCAIMLHCADATPTSRMAPYIDAMMIAVRRGVGLHVVCDIPQLSANAQHALSYFCTKLAAYPAQLTPSCFDTAAQYAKTGSPLLAGMVGSLPNDLGGSGYFVQDLRPLPFAVSTERFSITGYKNVKRTATLTYSKKLDRWDSLRHFKAQGFAKLTDVRFKKIDMSGSDDFWITIGYPAITPQDAPDISISDVEILETDGPLAFNTLSMMDKIVKSYCLDPSNNEVAGQTVAYARSSYPNYEVATQAVRTYPVNGDANNAYQRWWGCAVYKVNIRGGRYLWHLGGDNRVQFYLNGNLVSDGEQDQMYFGTGVVIIPDGENTIEVRHYNYDDNSSFSKNPTCVSLLLHRSFRQPILDLLAMGDKVLATLNITLSTTVQTTALDVQYKTVDGTALAGSDYVATSGTVTFDKDADTKQIQVEIIGETKIEPDEEFYVDIVPARGTAVKARGIVTIKTDDLAIAGGNAIASGADGVTWYPVEFGSDTKMVVATIVPYTQPDRMDVFDSDGNFLTSSNEENDVVIGNVNPAYDYFEWVAAGSSASTALSQNLPKHSGFSTVFIPHYIEDDTGSAFFLRIEGAPSTGWNARTFIDHLPVVARAKDQITSAPYNCHGHTELLDMDNEDATLNLVLNRLADGYFGIADMQTLTGVALQDNYQMRVAAGAKLVVRAKGKVLAETTYCAVGSSVQLSIPYNHVQHGRYLELCVLSDPTASFVGRGNFQTASTPVGCQTRLDWTCSITVGA